MILNSLRMRNNEQEKFLQHAEEEVLVSRYELLKIIQPYFIHKIVFSLTILLSYLFSGSYTDSPGLEYIRKHVAEYIQRRDGGIPCDWKDVVLCAGASDGIKV